MTAESADAAASLFDVRFDELGAVWAGRPAPPGGAAAGARFTLSIVERSSPRAVARVATGPSAARWQLLVKHRAGSVDAAIGRLRARNLFISSGILLLLAFAVGLVLVSAERARRLASQQMEFVASVSHELRTPLAVIRSAGENLADGVVDDRSQIRRYGALIAGEGRRLTDMVEQVLEFAGVQSGRRRFEPRPTEVTAVLDGALATCAPLVEEGGFELEDAIEAELPMVMADSAALQRAVQNLLTNAMKYSGMSRWVGLRVVTAAGTRGRVVRISVEDRGLGIDPADRAHVFEPFYRGQQAAALQIHGSGLGLSLVRKIVDAHGGRVDVVSTPGSGSTFTIELPALGPVTQKANAGGVEPLRAADYAD
jgi:signal transduction histidine kinase